MLCHARRLKGWEEVTTECTVLEEGASRTTRESPKVKSVNKRARRGRGFATLDDEEFEETEVVAEETQRAVNEANEEMPMRVLALHAAGSQRPPSSLAATPPPAHAYSSRYCQPFAASSY